MRAGTHLLWGAVAASPAAAAVAMSMHGAPVLVPLAVGAGAALVADVDHPSSPAARWTPFLRPAERVRGDGSVAATGRYLADGLPIWHRGPTHSAPVALAVALLAGVMTGLVYGDTWPQWGVVIGCAVLLGMLSHLALDLLTPSPLTVWWPLRREPGRPHWLPPVRWEHRDLVAQALGVVALAVVVWGLLP